MRYLPNLLTFLRILIAPLLAYLVLKGQIVEALGIVLLAALSDWFDGWTARKIGIVGNVGVLLDPIADKIMLLTLFVSMSVAGLIPHWLLSLAIGRDLVIVTGSVLLRKFRGIRTFKPIVLGKVSTFFQIIYLLLALLEAALPLRVLHYLTILALILTALFTALSGFSYVRIGIRLTRRLPA